MTARQIRIAVWASVVSLAVAASISGITNGFAFDDLPIIVENSSTHSLAHWWQLFAQSYWPLKKGGDLYRPVTMLGFAIQWTIGGGSPFVFHVVSILLYALICATFFAILLELLPTWAAWLGAALFAVHPLHVEAVANVVGQSELLAALFMFLALLVFLRARRRGPISLRDASIILLLYLFGCLSKEHAIVFPALLLAAEATVVKNHGRLRDRLVAIRPLVLSLAVVGLAFLWVRIHVLGTTAAASDESNALLLGQPFSIRVMTMLRVLLEWVRLFFWPEHLSADYSPRAIELVTGPSPEMLASAAILVGFAVLAWMARRRAPVATFAFLWVAIALLIPSNLIIPTGFSVAERTLFFASGGVMLGVAASAAYVMENRGALTGAARQLAIGAVGTVLLLGLVRSGFRQRVWRDNYTIFAQTVEDSPASYKAHVAYSAVLLQQKRRSEALDELRLANALFPADPSAIEYVADAYARVEGCPRAIPIYAHILAKDPRRARSRVGLAACLIALHDHEGARKTIRQGLANGASRSVMQQLMAMNDSSEASLSSISRLSSDGHDTLADRNRDH
jgi:protein O-mannosyl-transferase